MTAGSRLISLKAEFECAYMKSQFGWRDLLLTVDCCHKFHRHQVSGAKILIVSI